MFCPCKWYSGELPSGILNTSQMPRQNMGAGVVHMAGAVHTAGTTVFLMEAGSGACGLLVSHVCMVMKLSRHNEVS